MVGTMKQEPLISLEPLIIRESHIQSQKRKEQAKVQRIYVFCPNLHPVWKTQAGRISRLPLTYCMVHSGQNETRSVNWMAEVSGLEGGSVTVDWTHLCVKLANCVFLSLSRAVRSLPLDCHVACLAMMCWNHKPFSLKFLIHGFSWQKQEKNQRQSIVYSHFHIVTIHISWVTNPEFQPYTNSRRRHPPLWSHVYLAIILLITMTFSCWIKSSVYLSLRYTKS